MVKENRKRRSCITYIQLFLYPGLIPGIYVQFIAPPVGPYSPLRIVFIDRIKLETNKTVMTLTFSFVQKINIRNHTKIKVVLLSSFQFNGMNFELSRYAA